MNKLIFTLKDDFCDDIVLIANNHKDLEEYLEANFGWVDVRFQEDCVSVRKGYDDSVVYADIQWVKHI